MDTEAMLLHALHNDPADRMAWLALGDWCEEQGQSDRAELIRLWLALRQRPLEVPRQPEEDRLSSLLALGVPPCVPLVTNSLGMQFSLVPPGTFWMGAGKDDHDHFVDELPRHRVTLTRAFYLGVSTVTQEQYQTLIGHNPSYFSLHGQGQSVVTGLDTRSFPIEQVSWEDAVIFCARLSALPAERQPGRVYRLPTEAEWEYACRGAGTSTTPFHSGRGLSPALANFDGRFPYGEPPGHFRSHPVAVGSLPPNVLGLCEMHGNVWEWCADWYDSAYYNGSPAVDPTGPSAGDAHVQRGGSWYSSGRLCRSACRNVAPNPETTGFRVAMTASGKGSA
jgi:uncharacterized protein (TIGR02996 family)